MVTSFVFGSFLFLIQVFNAKEFFCTFDSVLICSTHIYKYVVTLVLIASLTHMLENTFF